MDRPAHPAADNRRETPTVTAGVSRFPRSRALAQVLYAAAGIVLFLLALKLVQRGAGGLVPFLDAFNVQGPANGLGFGWLFSYLTLSGSPVAAISTSLVSVGAVSVSEALAMMAGSRMGASFIVLAVGYVSYRRGNRLPDGLAVGVIALLVTFSTQAPALLLGLGAIELGWDTSLTFSAPTGIYDAIDGIYDAPIDFVDRLLPSGLIFLSGVGALLGGLAVFDRALPSPEGEAEGLLGWLHVSQRVWLFFLLGAAVTATTMSVAVSVTALVPLALKGHVRREHVIPYVMGANITTFIDTLFAAISVGGGAATAIVVIEIGTMAILSAVILAFCYGRYAALILRGSAWVTHRDRNFALFLGGIVAVPLVLLLL